MFKLKGKLGEAKIFTDLCDSQTIGQVLEVLNSPIAENSQVRIMPDCHAGAGCVIGTTMTVQNKLCPNIVGVDIGCGMLCINLGKIDIDLKSLDDFIHNNIPSGFEVGNDSKLYKESEQYINRLLCFPQLGNISRLCNSLGSLGGGNHFIEIDKDNDENKYLVIHTGSRNLGKQVAEIYQDLAIEHCSYKEQIETEKKNIVTEYKILGKQTEIPNAIQGLYDKYKNLSKLPETLSYLEGQELKNYLHDMVICQKFAQRNRKVIADKIINHLFKDSTPKLDSFETVHNYINFEDMILRKGAISAHKDEIVLIPLNMRDGSLICKGLGNPDWNYSAPHGAGRLMSRAQAKDNINLQDFEKTMEGIYSTSVNQSTIDESPFAYKPMESIVENIKETVEIIKRIVPIYNFKASEK